MAFRILFSDQAERDYQELTTDKGLMKRLKAVQKTLALLETNPRHPSLHSHEFTALTRVLGTKVFEAYAENKTPAAYRVFWCYGPGKDAITVIAITPHP